MEPPFEVYLLKFQLEEIARAVLQTDFMEGPPPPPAPPPLCPNVSVCPPPSQSRYLQSQLNPRLVLPVLASMVVGLLYNLLWFRLRHSLSRIFQLHPSDITGPGEDFPTRLGGLLARVGLV